ncbi:hypothetical protein HUT18_00015 [Streptomyces sp. NA04227]|uniref:hypothetical protein n=1 Tax=Streptomyces sp. NA04227 TaxID=2742136 RepID=UPI00158FE2C2|nr:hypothetical protein [Streptomyces sp. NA04227]QKW04979.1 hypothetical protein HUT18_00015 [Streptomyces sp. NA04227]
MGISVVVRVFSGESEARFWHPAIPAVCERASSQNLPLLGCVDPYDDTVFNRAQLRILIPELQALAEGAAADEAEAVRQILGLTAQVQRKPHRYLVFNGD